MKYQRYSEQLSKDIIKNVYKANKLELTPELLHFEENYAGILIQHKGFSIEYKTIWGGGFPFNPELAIIEYENYQQVDSNFLIRCTDINIVSPIHYALDEKGRFYEDYVLTHNSFEDMLKELKTKHHP